MASGADVASDPWYRAVAQDQRIEAVLPAVQWIEVIVLVDRIGTEANQARQKAGLLTRTFRKAKLPPLPPRAWALEVVPLLRVLAEDAKKGSTIDLRADMRGPKCPDKQVAAGRLKGEGRVRHIDETVYVDPWLSLAARLDDGTRVSVAITDRLRHRTVHKRSASGKHKTKNKEKAARRVDVQVAGQTGEHDLVVPTPPPRLPVFSKPEATRPTATARLDHPLPPPGGDGARLVLKALAEVHRHLRPRTRGAG